MNQAARVGIDLGKHSFHLHGQDSSGREVFRRKLTLWRLVLEYARTFAGDISRERLRELELALRREAHRQAQELG